MLKNIVIIGYGNIARKHIEVLKALGCNIAATSNRSVEKRDMAMQEGISMVYSDYHQMIQKEKPDGIIVCVSFWNMFTVLSDIIPYGIPILAEKPTGTSLAEHKSLQVLASKYKTPIMVALNRRHYSVLNKAIELAGGKQNITNVLIEWSEDPFHLANKKKLNNELIHKTIFENTIHGLDLLTYLAGEISDINISAVNLGDPFRWIMNISGKSDTNTIYNFNSSMDNFVPWRVVFYAQNKRFVFAPLESCEYTEGKQKTVIEPDSKDISFKAGFYNQANIFVNQAFVSNKYDLASVNNSMLLAEKLYEQFMI